MSASYINKAFRFFLFLSFLIGSQVSTAQTLSIIGANSPANGISPSSLVYGQKDIVLFGFGITSDETFTVGEINISSSGNGINGYFSNWRLFRSGDQTFSADDVPVDGAKYTAVTANIAIENIKNLSVGTNATYFFLVADYTNTAGAIPGSVQFKFSLIQSPSAISGRGPQKFNSYNFDLTGTTFSIRAPSITVVGLNNPGNGITQPLISFGQTGIVLFGFSVTAEGSSTISEFNILNEGTASNSQNYFTGGKLYRSQDGVFSSGDAQTGTVTFQGSNTKITGLTEALANGETRYYFLVADYDRNGLSGLNMQFKFKSGQQSPAITEIAPKTKTTNTLNITGQTFVFARTTDWLGYSSSWNNASNWSGGFVPGPNDIANIAVSTTSTFDKQPVIDGNTTVGAIILGTIKPISLSVNQGYILTARDIIQNPGIAAISNSITGGGKIVTDNLRISNAAINPPLTTDFTTKITLSINSFSLNNSLILLSKTYEKNKNSIFRNDAALEVQNGTVTVNEQVQTINSTGVNSTVLLTSETGTLILKGVRPFNLSSVGTNTLTLQGTTSFEGTNQEVSSFPSYNNLTLKGNGTLAPAAKTIGSGTLKVTGNLTLTKPAEMKYSGTTALDIDGNLEGDEFINPGTLPINIAGDWNNTVKGEVKGLVTYDGQNNQKVAGLDYTDLLFTNGGTKTITAPATVSGELEVKKGSGTGNTTLNANGNLTLLANASSNANLKKLDAGADVTGLVTVQSYVSGGKRAYLTFSSPVYDNTNSKGKVFTYKQLQNYMIVTGARNGGFDLGSAANPYGGTIRTYFEPASPTQNQYYSPTNINETIEAGKAFYVFYRGNRNNPASKLTAPYAIPEANTIEFKGQINQGNVIVPLSYTDTQNPLDDGFNHLGNPYPSTIDFHQITKSDPEITKIWILRKDGFYAVYDSKLPGAGVNGASRYIPPGQGFFVKATKSGSTVTFTENCKVTSKTQKPLERFMTADRNFVSTLNESKNEDHGIPFFRLAMKKGQEMADETVIAFKENAESAMDEEDAVYMGGAEISFSSLSSDNRTLSINYMPEATDGSTIKLNVSATASGDYSISLADITSLDNLNIYLKDEFLNSSVDLKANSTYAFRIDKTLANSFGSDRFKLVFERVSTLPIRLVNFTGKKSKVGTELKWATASEKNIDRFEIERSQDGKEFINIGRVKSVGNSTSKADYLFEDRNPIAGTNYYRLKQVGITGMSSYIDPITVDFSADKSNMDLKLYPNPTVDEIYVSLEGLSGTFAVRIFNTAGYEVKNSVVNYSGPVSQKVSDLQKGTYFIRVTDTNTNALLAIGKFIKN